MPYKNPKELLIAATALPAAIEAKLPTGAPKISQTLTDIANKLPVAPDFPMELPDLPAVPTLPAAPGGAALRRTYVRGVEVTPVRPPAPAPAPAVPTGKIPLIFE
jgi:hypothetical protein